MEYSAAELIKRSAAQLVYYRINKIKPEVTSNKLVGEMFQDQIYNRFLANNEPVYEEMCGCYSTGPDNIWFSVDLVAPNLGFFEVKSILDSDGNHIDTYPLWYLYASLVQCAIYKALILETKGCILRRAQFKLNTGAKPKRLRAKKGLDYFLIFGNTAIYRIEVKNSKALVNYLVTKKDSLLNYSTAREFDAKYKHREFEILKEYFTYTKLEQPCLAII